MQFFHYKWCSGSTIAIEFPTKVFFEDSLIKSHSTDILLSVGLSIKSDKDVFNKKIGRQVSTSNVKPTPCSFISLYVNGTKHIYNFTVKNYEHNSKKYNINFYCTTVKESDNIWLVDGAVYVA